MSKFKRILKHLVAGRWQVGRILPSSSMHRIQAAISQSERSHDGELRFAVETGLEWPDLLHGTTPRARAIKMFSRLRVWDTEHNSGVLIYLLLADRKVEIVADRGVHARVGQAGWESICRKMEQRFRLGEFEAGVLEGIAAITTLLQQHFPASGDHRNELPDAPIVL